MDAAHWKQLDRLLQSVLERPVEHRDVYLHEICAGDEGLERELRALVDSERAAAQLLDQPPIAIPAIDWTGVDATSAPHATDSPIGRTTSHYRILEQIGAGGMGVVYKAEDERLHRLVAVKFLADDLARDPDALNRFRREARTASALNHPNICTIHDIGEQDGRAFLVMEYLEGGTLKDRIAEKGGLPLDTVLTLGSEIGDALDAAHHVGIVHRDIKPANIFIDRRGHAKILDFGLAKMWSAGDQDIDARTMTSTATRGGMVLGTAAYMAPEQARGEPIDQRADLWAFGLVLYEMLKGTRPVAAVQLRLDESPGLQRIVSTCLETDREKRYQHASEIRDELQRLKRDTEATPASGSGTRTAIRRRRTLIVCAVAAALLLAVAGYVSRHRPPKLTDKDTVVLADFDNTTGDPVFDVTLRQGLAVQLEQSPFLSLVSDERIQGVLRLMGQPAESRLTPQVAREICERTGGAAVLEGSIASLGSQFVLGLRAKNCHTGDVLDAQQVQAAGKETVLKALSTMASTFRTRVGESLATVERHNTPLEDATTSSLDALRAYSAGRKLHISSGPAALPLLQARGRDRSEVRDGTCLSRHHISRERSGRALVAGHAHGLSAPRPGQRQGEILSDHVLRARRDREPGTGAAVV